jgi:hypothetical protein
MSESRVMIKPSFFNNLLEERALAQWLAAGDLPSPRPGDRRAG